MPIIHPDQRFEYAPGIFGRPVLRRKYVSQLGGHKQLGGFINFASLITPFKVLQHAFRVAAPSMLPKIPAVSTLLKGAANIALPAIGAAALPVVASKVVDMVLPKPTLPPGIDTQVATTMLAPPAETVAKLPARVIPKDIPHGIMPQKNKPAEVEEVPVPTSDPAPRRVRRFGGGLNKNSKKIADKKYKNIMKSLKRGGGLNML